MENNQLKCDDYGILFSGCSDGDEQYLNWWWPYVSCALTTFLKLHINFLISKVLNERYGIFKVLTAHLSLVTEEAFYKSFFMTLILSMLFGFLRALPCTVDF